jgi:hypothetical protein
VHGNQPRPVDDADLAWLAREDPGQLEVALQHGLHQWRNHRTAARLTETIDVRTRHRERETWVVRPPTEAKQAAAAHRQRELERVRAIVRRQAKPA